MNYVEWYLRKIVKEVMIQVRNIKNEPKYDVIEFYFVNINILREVTS
jgi:hypothetical protein